MGNSLRLLPAHAAAGLRFALARGIRFALVFAVFAAAAAAQPPAGPPPSEGALVRLAPDGSEAARLAYRLSADSVVLTAPGGAPFVLTPTEVRALAAHLDLIGADPVATRTQVGYRDGHVDVGFMRRLSAVDVGLGLLAVGAVVAAGFAGRRARRDRQSRALFDAANRAALESREAERLRLAREIHDGPIQDLVGVQMMMALAGAGAPAPLRSPDELREDIAGTIGELRAIADGLRPPALGPFGLAPALEGLVDRFLAWHPDIAFDVDVEADGQRVPERERLAVYRVAQEALHNAVVHGAPRTVSVRLRLDPVLRLEVEDDGAGFSPPADPTQLRAEGHFGVLGMMERAELLGGRLSFALRTGGGTRVRLDVPWGRLAPAPPREPRVPARRPVRALG